MCRTTWEWMWQHSCILCSVPVGTDGKSRIGVQTGTRNFGVFRRFSKFRCVSASTYISAGLLFWFFFLCSPSSPPLLLLPSSSFFFQPNSLSVTFLYFLSFVFLPKRRRRNGFWFKCHAPLPSSSSFLFSSLCVPFLYFFFLSFWFKCRPSCDVIRYLFEIFIPFALWRVMHSFVLLFFILFFFLFK
jgi:hypothetical protein